MCSAFGWCCDSCLGYGGKKLIKWDFFKISLEVGRQVRVNLPAKNSRTSRSWFSFKLSKELQSVASSHAGTVAYTITCIASQIQNLCNDHISQDCSLNKENAHHIDNPSVYNGIVRTSWGYPDPDPFASKLWQCCGYLPNDATEQDINNNIVQPLFSSWTCSGKILHFHLWRMLQANTWYISLNPYQSKY